MAAGIPPSDRPFVKRNGEPKLVRCAVLFVDILGVREMNLGREAATNLIKLERAISRTYRDFLDPRSAWRAAFFSDTLVLATPVDEAGGDEYAVGGLAVQAALLQLDLARQGFFLRGGISIGQFHIRHGLIFGRALVDAYELENRTAVQPRVVFARAAESTKQEFIASPAYQTGGVALAPLMKDGDGEVFVNYLALAFDYPDSDETFAAHRDQIVDQLHRHRTVKPIWEKYRWTAEYHNAVLAQAPSMAFPQGVDASDLMVAGPDRTWRFEPFV